MAQIDKAQGKQQVNVQRAVIIGLGGTGAEVIRRVREQVVHEFGALDKLPILRFLYLDTDPTWIQRATSELDESIRLTEAELVDAQIADATGLYRSIQEGTSPHYRWFTLERLKSITNVTKGAGTIRQMGRLCFWQHFADIRDQLGSIVRSVNDDTNARYMQETWGMQVDPGINIHIVAGLAGGTGSGCFLDMAYMARKVISDQGIAGTREYTAYLVLPGAFQDLKGTSSLPNGFAALRELNYLNYRPGPDNPLYPLYGDPEWRCDYAGDGRHEVLYKSQPPFDICYLLDSSNGHVQLTRAHIFTMIAQSLFNEFSLEFSSYKRALRANIRNQITANDVLDCPANFMSFGQSVISFPTRDVREVLTHQLALRAVQGWIDRDAKPVRVVAGGDADDSQEDAGAEAIASIIERASDAEMQAVLRGYVTGDYLPRAGLMARDVLASVTQSEKVRLKDIPYQWIEDEKKRWLSEEWRREQFEGRLQDAAGRWRRAFNDDGPDPVAWGEQIRWMLSNQEKALKRYRAALQKELTQALTDPKRGPAWACAFVRVLSSAMLALKKQFLEEANSATFIANQLNDVFLKNHAHSGDGASLTPLIEQRIGQEFAEVHSVVAEILPVYLLGGIHRLRAEAYEYLTWCAHWCRGRTEERGRRLAADLCQRLADTLVDSEQWILDTAGKLALAQTELLQKAQSCAKRIEATERVGQLLFSPALVDVLEQRICELRGDAYDPAAVGSAALKKLDTDLGRLSSVDAEKLAEALIESAGEAIGSLAEEDLAETRFAAYDILTAESPDSASLNRRIADAIEVGAPFVRLSEAPPGGFWQSGDRFPSGLLETRGVALRGGYQPEGGDIDRFKVCKAIASAGWDPKNDVCPISKGEQIVFVQECGGFPLRALADIELMEKAYENHRKVKQNTPLHIWRDELAARLPDIMPPLTEDLDNALQLQAVARALGLVAERDFPNPDGSGRALRQFAFLRHEDLTNESTPVPLGDTAEASVMRLAYDPDLAKLVKDALDKLIARATADEKAAIKDRLLAFLNERKVQIAAAEPTVSVDANPHYQKERDRLTSFIRDNNLE